MSDSSFQIGRKVPWNRIVQNSWHGELIFFSGSYNSTEWRSDDVCCTWTIVTWFKTTWFWVYVQGNAGRSFAHLVSQTGLDGCNYWISCLRIKNEQYIKVILICRTVVMPDSVPPERVELIQSLGCDVVQTPLSELQVSLGRFIFF